MSLSHVEKVIVLGTKNSKPILPYLHELDERGIHYYFQVTLNDYADEDFELQLNFVILQKTVDMGKDKMTREEVLIKLRAAKEKKRECLKQLEKSMKEIYKEHTGKEAKNFFAL